MKTTSVTDAKARLSQLLELVQQGETVLILSRGKPVARLEPIRGETSPSALRLEHLVRRGIVRRAAVRLDPASMGASPVPTQAGGSLLDALLSDRREGR